MERFLMPHQATSKFRKNNPSDVTSRKRKKGKSEVYFFIHFKDDIMKHTFNNHVLENGRLDAVVNTKDYNP